MNNMQSTIRYLISFLVRDDNAAGQVGYTSDEAQYTRYSVVIKPSGWLSQVGCPLQARRPEVFDFEGSPVLFGAPRLYRKGDTVVVEADWVASSYYLLTRYEELQCEERDAHGRYTGEQSLLYQLDWLQRPLIEAYSNTLRALLVAGGCLLPPIRPGKIVLTHDIDASHRFHDLRSVLGGVRRRQWGLLRQRLKGMDPYADFAGIDRMDKALPWAESVWFAHVAGKTGCAEDAHCIPLSVNDWLQSRTLSWGIHFSAMASQQNSRLPQELALFDCQAGHTARACRYHYLMLPDSDGWNCLQQQGVTDDYSVGYADLPGFRLGTCRPVRHIDPTTGELSDSLTLHPLSLMDVTLSDYARLPFREALSLADGICRKACADGGEAVLLWHNSSLSQGASGYHRSLYIQLLDAWAADGIGKPTDSL